MPVILSVRELATYIHQLLEYDEVLADVWVQGEVSNLARSSAGHVYFTLKEADAQISCALFRHAAARLERLPADGEAILAHGQVSFYEAGGKLQLYVDTLRPLGVGMLYLRFQELKARLEAEGLFSPEQKRPLPPFPRRIGVVTSPTGAALRDILHILGRRYPLVQVVISPTPVQGKEAAGQIVAALERLRGRDVDLIVVARGGGSLEDLWPFNEEIVARAIRAADVPVVSGVGHETDFTIADFAADVRAPTPSAAAEIVVPDQAGLRAQWTRLRQRVVQSVRRLLGERRLRLGEQRRMLRRLSPRALIASQRQRVDDLAGRAGRSLGHRLGLSRERLRTAALRLAALDPRATLQRGYAIVRRASGEVVLSPAQVALGDRLDVQVRDGEFGVEVAG
jgi:exodeoxyribonuclease VII large subunit